MSKADGGYYAIKGFEYQIDKSIIEILNSDDENNLIGIERIQDVDSNSWVMQIKYKETKDFVPSAVREPIIQLLEEYKINNTKKYYLYCYFKSLNGYEGYFSNLTLDNLDTILKNEKDKFTKDEKESFLLNFILENSATFQNQFEQVILKLKNDFSKNEDEAVIYYSIITDYLRKLVINNRDETNRICNKKQIREILNNSKRIIFNSVYREYKGDNEYFKYIKKQYFTCRNMDFWERFIIIELKGTEKINEIKDVVLKLKDKYYKEQKQLIKSGAPYIFIKNINDSTIKNLKGELINEGYILKDGYDFKNADFNIKTIIEKSTKENKICIKFIDEENNLKEVLKQDLGTVKEIYQFCIKEEIDINFDLKNITVQIKEINDISKIL